MGYGLGSFAGGLAAGINNGMQLSLMRQRAQREDEEFKEKQADRQALKDYAREMGANASRIGTDEVQYSVPGMTDGFKTTDPDTAAALAGVSSDAGKPTTYEDGTTVTSGQAPAAPVSPVATSRRYTQQDFDSDRLKLAGRLGLGQQADQAAATVLANRQAEAIRRAGMAGEFTPIAREFNVIGQDQNMVGGTNPATGKYHVAVFNADGSVATDKAGRPMGRVFDSHEHAVATLSAMADPKTLASMYMNNAKGESAMERLIAANMMRPEKGYGAKDGSGRGGKEDKNPYGWLDFKTFVGEAMPKDPVTGAAHPGATNGFETYRALLQQNPGTLGASEQGNAAAINIATRVGTGQLKPYAEMLPDGVWSGQVQHGTSKFTLQQVVEPTGGAGNGALIMPPREKVVAMDRAWLESLSKSPEGQDIYRQAALLAANDAAFSQTAMVVKQGGATTQERMLWAAADKLRRLRNEGPDKPVEQKPAPKPLINFTPTPGAGTVGRNSDNFNFFR